ncbi:flagellar biosynthetic protein FliR [Sulfurospirillum deleyianum]|uniref:Flagellar biosynthetic protein FliR n=1 Tax=Sulfurospirillum deleyianum (strain ATCC 51133 / DSM 6946 / 5175) TaxID=525898 RepID=D1AZH9_SULD5|nr:flagellar biosynthetic protein FliR [Sulfurospirillum deleyianum]ACZ11446.1 flagellar biosynthetic protein FliR [Sulfurospirillum deleyianum DSM 6946]
MESLVKLFGEHHVILFFLLFARLSGVFAFFPFFSHANIPLSIKTSITFFMVVFLFPLLSPLHVTPTLLNLTLAIVSELLIGFIAGLFLTIALSILQMAGMQISFVMGFTMASVVDPQTSTSIPVLSQIFSLIGLMIVLAFNGHHQMLLFIVDSLSLLPLGTFYPEMSVVGYILKATTGMFVYGFILSFPVLAFSLLMDVVFGMLMKTMPQFNLLVVGFPIRIAVSLVVIIVTLASTMLLFKREFMEAINQLTLLFAR